MGISLKDIKISTGPGISEGPGVGGANFYVAEDNTTFYVTEDGLNNYVTES